MDVKASNADAWDTLNEYGADELDKRIFDYVLAADLSEGDNPAESTADETPGYKWPEAVDLFGNLELTPFPIQLLPAVIGDYSADHGELMGVDPGVIAMAALAVTAACCDDRIQIQPKRRDPTWTESARLWFGVIAPPSAKKTPALSKAVGPAYAIESEWRKHSAALMKDHEQALAEHKKSKSTDPPPEHPVLKRLIFEDVTVEKLGDAMSKAEPRGVLVFRDELTGWLASMDAYKHGSGKDRAAWLEAYNGGPQCIDRIGRGSTFVENWSACVVGGIQPAVVEQYAGNTNHDGMLQRFILLFAADATKGQDRYPDMDAKRAYQEMVKRVSTIQAGSAPVMLSEGAHAAKEALWDDLHVIVHTHPNHFLTAALGKWEGLSARLMLTFHVAECATKRVHPNERTVSADTASRVCDLMRRCLLHHALRFYQSIDETGDKARHVAGLILAKGWDRFTVKRDIDRYLSASRKWKPWEIEAAMRRLDSFGWIRPDGRLNEQAKPVGYVVNPDVHQQFAAVAESERERRALLATKMKELQREMS